MRKFLGNYALGLWLWVAFLLSWGLQLATHSGTWSEFWNATAENWESEFLQLLTFVVLSRFFIFHDSPQSRDGSDRMQADLREIKLTQHGILQRIKGKSE